MKHILIVTLLLYYVQAKDFVFGVVPQQSPLEMMKRWLPIAEYISNKTGFNIIFKPAVSIPEFEKELYAGIYDMAYMNPYHYVKAHEIYGYTAMVRASENIQGILVGRKELAVLDRDILLGKTFLFPAPNAFAATLLIKFEFKNTFGLDIEKETIVRYVNSHESVYKGVQRNIGDFGGGIIRTYKTMYNGENNSTLEILYKTKVYPSHPIAINPRCSLDERQRLENALLSIPENLLRALNMRTMIKTKHSEYDSIRDLMKDLD